MKNIATFILWIVSMSFAAGTYFHTQASVNQEVIKVKVESSLNSKLICLLAIDLGARSVKDICTRKKLH